MTSTQDRVIELIEGASRIELICLLGISHAITGKEITSIAKAPKSTLNQAIKELREAQLHHPEISEFENAIQYIQQAIRGGKENKT